MKNRLDVELVNRGLVPSRSKAKELITNGYIKCNNIIIDKCSYSVSSSDEIIILENDTLKYVSRAGLKLDKAINDFNIDFNNKNIMDIGSSTGGFTDCSIKNGASSVISIDVGTDLMHESLRNNPKVKLFEQTDFRSIDKSLFNNIDIIVCDVSFISLKKIIDKIYNENIKTDIICLIKPQFECGMEIASKYKGIILNKDIHKSIISDLISYFNNKGFYLNNITYSPIRGGDGNIEYISYFTNKKTNNIEIDINNLVNNSFKSLN